jgi:hypothetical protein
VAVAQIPVAVDDYRIGSRAGDGTFAPTGTPNTINVGDLEILTSWADDGTHAITTAGGSAWAAVTGSPFAGPGSEKLYVWWRVAQSGDTLPTLTVSGSTVTTSSHLVEHMQYAQGSFDPANPIDAVSAGASGTTPTTSSTGTIPTLTTTVDKARVLSIVGRGSLTSIGSITQTGSTYQSLLAQSTTLGNDSRITLQEAPRATAGVVPAGTVALGSGTADPWISVALAVRPYSMAASSTYSSWGSAVTADSPRNWWKFDETSGTTAADSGSTPTNGTYAGSPTLGSTPVIANGTGKSATFDGADDEMSVAVQIPAIFTLEEWIDDWTTVSGENDVLVRDNTGSAGWIPFWINGVFTTRIQGTNVTPNNANSVGTTPRDGNRHHLVVQKAGAIIGGIRLYLDGVLIAAGTSSSTALSVSPLHFGRNGTLATATDFAAYRQDDAALYTSALSHAKIVAHYEAGISAAQNFAPGAAIHSQAANGPSIANATPQALAPAAATATHSAGGPALANVAAQSIAPGGATRTPAAYGPAMALLSASVAPGLASHTAVAHGVELSSEDAQVLALGAAARTPTAGPAIVETYKFLLPGSAGVSLDEVNGGYIGPSTVGGITLVGIPPEDAPPGDYQGTPPILDTFNDTWMSRTMLGALRPHQVVQIRRGRWNRGPRAVPDEQIIGADIPGEFAQVPWMCWWSPAEEWVDVPGVVDCKISNSLDQNGLATATLQVESVRLAELTGTTGMTYHKMDRGYLAPERGYVDPDRGVAGGPPNEWAGRLSRVAQIRVWQGYGPPQLNEGDMPLDGGTNGAWTFIGQIDDIDMDAVPDRVVVTCRQGQPLTDERLFGWNKSKQLKDPITFGPSGKKGGRRWIYVDDAADVVRCVLRWAGYRDWDVEDTGTSMKGHKTYNRGTFLIDIIRDVCDESGYLFFMGRPPHGESTGLPTFRRRSALMTVNMLGEVSEHDVLLDCQPKEDTENLAYIIRVRGKVDEDAGMPLGGDASNRLMSVYRPPWSYEPGEGGDDRLGGLIKHVTHTENALKTIDQCEVASRLIALEEALSSFTASIQTPGHVGVALDEQIGVTDSSTAVNSRLWVTAYDSSFTTGEETTFTTTMSGSLIDTEDIKTIIADIENFTPTPSGPRTGTGDGDGGAGGGSDGGGGEGPTGGGGTGVALFTGYHRSDWTELQRSSAGATATGGLPSANGTDVVEHANDPLGILPSGIPVLEMRLAEADHFTGSGGLVRVQARRANLIQIDGSKSYWFVDVVGVPASFPVLDSGWFCSINSYFGEPYAGTSAFPLMLNNVGGQNYIAQMNHQMSYIWRTPATPGYHVVVKRFRPTTDPSGWIEMYYAHWGSPLAAQALRVPDSGGSLSLSNTRLTTTTIRPGQADGPNDIRIGQYRHWPQSRFPANGIQSIMHTLVGLYDVADNDLADIDPVALA